MSETPRHVLALWALGLLAVVLLGARALHHSGGGSAGAAAPIHVGEADGGGSSRIVVHVAGAVRRPGVYRLPAGSRVNDAVRRAGGAAPPGSLEAINLAARLADGQQVVVPESVPGGGAATVAAGEEGPISLGTATVEQLEEIEGIGPVTA